MNVVILFLIKMLKYLFADEQRILLFSLIAIIWVNFLEIVLLGLFSDWSPARASLSVLAL